MSKIYFFIIFLFCFLNFFASANEFIKPNKDLSPFEVVEIQMLGLQSSSENKNIGIEQVWIFAHPDNKKATGPLNKFKLLFENPAYLPLIGNIGYEIKTINIDNEIATLIVSVIGIDDNIYEYYWILKKLFTNNNDYYWLTSSVSTPKVKKQS